MGGLHAWLHVHEPTDACRKGYESVAAAYLAPPPVRLSASCRLRPLSWFRVVASLPLRLLRGKRSIHLRPAWFSCWRPPYS